MGNTTKLKIRVNDKNLSLIETMKFSYLVQLITYLVVKVKTNQYRFEVIAISRQTIKNT